VTINFKIWEMQGTGIIMQCLGCQTTFGVEHFDHIIRLWDDSVIALEDVKDEDLLKCPTCGRSITGEMLKAILNKEELEPAPPQTDLEGLMFLEDLLGNMDDEEEEEGDYENTE